jgi:hypothetical protein
MKTIGEKTFEAYLGARGINFEFERLPEGKKRPADYTLFHDRGKPLLKFLAAAKVCGLTKRSRLF